MLTSNHSQVKNDNRLSLSSLRYLPRWMIFLIDIFILFISLYFAFHTLEKLTSLPNYLPVEWKYIIIIGINIFYMYLLKTFAGIIRHSNFVDLQKIIGSSLLTFGTLLLVKYIVFWVYKFTIFFTSLLIFYFIISFTHILPP